MPSSVIFNITGYVPSNSTSGSLTGHCGAPFGQLTTLSVNLASVPIACGCIPNGATSAGIALPRASWDALNACLTHPGPRATLTYVICPNGDAIVTPVVFDNLGGVAFDVAADVRKLASSSDAIKETLSAGVLNQLAKLNFTLSEVLTVLQTNAGLAPVPPISTDAISYKSDETS